MPESHTIQKPKTSSGMNVAQLLRIRLNDDPAQAAAFVPLRQVKTSVGEDTNRQLPQVERMKYTPNVTGSEGRVANEREFHLGDQEDIVFEGHGKNKYYFFGERTMEGKGADALADIVNSVVRGFGNVDRWNGRVVLLGCYTEPIVLPLHQKLIELLEKEITIVGTFADITLGDGVSCSEGVHYKGNKPKAGMIDFTSPDDVSMFPPPESTWNMVGRDEVEA